MNAIRFTTSIGEDQTIRPPNGVHLAPGEVEVIVLPLDKALEPPLPSTLTLPQRLAQAAKELNITDLPSDLAENHDHYIHGTAKRDKRP